MPRVSVRRWTETALGDGELAQAAAARRKTAIPDPFPSSLGHVYLKQDLAFYRTSRVSSNGPVPSRWLAVCFARADKLRTGIPAPNARGENLGPR